jgi:general secretion pathway protein D
VTASSDDRTNTVVISGPADTLTVIERVIKEIDNNPASSETVTVYRLKNAQAINIEGVVNYLFNGTASSTGTRGTATSGLGNNRNQRSGSGLGGGGTGGRGTGGGGTGGFGGNRGTGGGGFGGGGGGFGGGGAFGGNRGGFGGGGISSNAQRSAAGLAGQVTVIADPDTNSLLVRTSPANLPQVRAILDELDRPVGQVLIKVLVAEVTHDTTTDVGAQFSVLNLRNGSTTAGQKGGTNFGLSSLSNGMVVQILESDFTATIRALESVGKLDVLSRPYILASDNQLASITVGQEVPFITNSRITDTGQTINTVEYNDVGILLDVIPHINPDGLVIMDVAPEISALTGTTVPISDTVASPVIAKRSAQSRVGVQNGQTIVIGGLMEDRKTETIDKVPLLGDIPWIGEAFKRRQSKKTKTELLIFLTPHVAQRPDMLQNMSKQEIEGSKLVPGAVDANAFQEHKDGLQRGATILEPSPPLTTPQPNNPPPQPRTDEPRDPQR